MAEFGTPYRTSEELLESIESIMQGLTEQMLSFADSLGSVSENAKDVQTSFSDSKTEKGLKGVTGMLQSMGKASIQAFALEQLMKLIEPFLMLLEPLGVIFDILGALLTVFTGEIMKALFDALQPLFDLLISLMPLFKILGQLFAILVTAGMQPLKVIMEVLNAILKPFLPLLEKLSPIFEIVGNVISWVVRIALLPLVGAIYAIGLGIAALINLFTFGAVDAIGTWNSLMLPILGSMVGLKEGGIVSQEGVYRLAEGNKKEAVVPLEKGGDMGLGGNSELHLMDIKDLLEQQVQLQRQQNTMQRRRFG